MDYLYENLGDERFQDFCAALISKEFKNMQAYPVGQPDGGRDAVVYLMESPAKEFIVFQVKFVRNANEQRDLHKWLIDTIEGEIDKINRLIPKGAIAYYLLTNVKGTAHLDAGSKDKIDAILQDKVKIPALCWWRDDLSRLFEKDPLFKWEYPEIISGQDILNSMVFEGLQENRSRREAVIKAYLTDQFEIDNEVKFKQIDLQNRLLTLYTDVPLRVKKINVKDRELKKVLINLNLTSQILGTDSNILSDEPNSMSAAQFLLNANVQQKISRVLIEGGPGQGKSTISQYVCQVHRVRLLNKRDDMEHLPDNIKTTPVRIPFKIDLRDLAAWIEKKNPYEAIINQDKFQSSWKDSLEAFLVSHVLYHAKIDEFTTSDFMAIVKSTPILIVFDGFDEIASMQVRSLVIEFINKGIIRLNVNSISIQVFITSRPAAFTDTVGFSIDHYPHFELTEITPSVISEYVEKWIKAGKLDSRDSNDLRKLIKEKLEMPHLKDLAKSPMQLAIFISLLRTKGQSLPNKRTALYDNYIELFFDRESEKSRLIRDHRELIIDIHQYLAWILHSEAELYKNSGSIALHDLNVRLKEYLAKEGHDTTIADQLFYAMKDRVCALVSRVQGTFEFEVQPLREYFCAKYLYKSAPHSSTGDNKKGTKPDRFNAILRSFYWQNVVRFFAGCADAGELDMIIQEIKYLQEDPILKYTDYPRIITAQILSDYVFTQKPLKLRDVVNIIVDGINVGSIINQDNHNTSNEALQIPNDCGRKEVIEECFKQLRELPMSDYAGELIAIINNNPLNTLTYWMNEVAKYKGKELTKWLEYAYRLKLIYKIDEDILLDILKEADQNEISQRLQIIIDGNRLQILERSLELKELVLNEILDYKLVIFERRKNGNSLNSLSLLLHPFLIGFIFRTDRANFTLRGYIDSYKDNYGDKTVYQKIDFEQHDHFDVEVSEFINSSITALDTPIEEFKSQVDPWDILIGNGEKIFGQRWIFKVIATISAGNKSKESYDGYQELTNNSLSLCKRVRCARLKSGNLKYWETIFSDDSDIIFKMLVFFTWATPKTIIHFLQLVSIKLTGLSKSDYNKLMKALMATVRNSNFTRSQDNYLVNLLSKVDNEDEIKYLISLRFNENRKGFVYSNVTTMNGKLETVKDDKYEYLLQIYLENPLDMEVLKKIKNLYPSVNDTGSRHYFRHQRISTKIPYEIAKTIMEDPINYPQVISSAAEKSCRAYSNQNLIAVGKIAEIDGWFEN